VIGCGEVGPYDDKTKEVDGGQSTMSDKKKSRHAYIDRETRNLYEMRRKNASTGVDSKLLFDDAGLRQQGPQGKEQQQKIQAGHRGRTLLSLLVGYTRKVSIIRTFSAFTTWRIFTYFQIVAQQLSGAGQLMQAAAMAKEMVGEQADTINKSQEVVEKLTATAKAAERAVGIKEGVVEKVTKEKGDLEKEVEAWRQKQGTWRRNMGVLIHKNKVLEEKIIKFQQDANGHGIGLRVG